jgi:hypothetical protein
VWWRGGVGEIGYLLQRHLQKCGAAEAVRINTSELESLTALTRPRERRAPLMMTLPPDLQKNDFEAREEGW